MIFAKTIRQKLHVQLGYCSSGQFPPKFGLISQWALLMVSQKARGRTTILVVVDCFSKYGHFTPINHP
jgi:hypothetical protein